jgi:hypothetical protein
MKLESQMVCSSLPAAHWTLNFVKDHQAVLLGIDNLFEDFFENSIILGLEIGSIDWQVKD